MKYKNLKRDFIAQPLAFKFSMVMVTIIVIIGAAIAIIMEKTLVTALYHEYEGKGLTIARNLAANALEPSLLDNLVRLQLLLKNIEKSDDEVVYAFIVDGHSAVRAHTFEGGFPADLSHISHELLDEGYGRRLIQTERGDILDISLPILTVELGYVHVGLSLTDISQKVSTVRMKIMFVSLVVMVLAVFISFLIARNLTKPLAALAKAAERIGQGDLSFRIPGQSDDEVGKVAQVFNKMAIDLENDHEKRLRTEAALKSSEAKYRSLVENMDLGVTLIDRDHNILMTNSAQGRMFNKSAEEFIGKKCFEEFEKEQSICSHCPGRKAMEEGKKREVITEGIRDDGSRFQVRIQAYPIIDEDGDASGFIEVVEDITVKQKMEEEIHRNRKIKSIGLLAGGLAHDFNNILQGIYGNVELAKILTKKDSKVQTILSNVMMASERTQHLTNQLITFSKGGDPVKSTYSIAKIIEENSRFLLAGSEVVCDLDIQDRLYSVEIDKGQIDQVFYNIILNAKEAMPQGGTITIQARNYDLDEPDLLPLDLGSYVKVAIRDQGGGIDQDILEQIFDPYFSTKDRGSEKGQGLGLAISLSIMRRHNGHVTVESRQDEGTTFTLFLPAQSELMEQDHHPTQELNTPAPTLRKKRILIMDDDEIVGDVVTEMLGHLGCTNEIAKNGEEALFLYKKAKEDALPFDLVILDLTIRGGMGGEETNKRLQEIDPDVRTIVTSGYADNPIISNYETHGFSAAIVKPFTLNALDETLGCIG